MKKLLLAASLLMAVALTAKSAPTGTTETPKPHLPAVKIDGNIALTGKMDDPRLPGIQP